jgi:pimeloyl-ACP methyl ester carboxylesterase
MLLSLLLAVVVDTTTVAFIPVGPQETLRVVLQGEGAPVVFIPGLLGSAYGFRHLTTPLSGRGYRTIVVEPLGMGGSDRPRHADYSLTAQAERVRAVLDSLGIASAVFVAHSLGSSIVLHLAARYPDRVRALVSIEGGLAETPMGPQVKRAMRWAPLLKLIASQDVVRPLLARELRASSGNGDWLDDDVLGTYMQDFAADVGATMDALRGMADATEPEGLGDRLADVRAPVLLLLGDAPHRGAPTEEEVADLVARVPAITIEHVPNAGHFLHEEKPERVLAALTRVLASETAQG